MSRLLNQARRIALDPRIGYDLLRMYLGVALFVRGAVFVTDPERVVSLVRNSSEWFWPYFVAQGVGIGHVSGGILLALGLATRVASVVQVPILFGAVFFVHWREGLLGANQSLELSGLVLVMLVLFSVFGAGPLSLDQVIFRRQRTEVPRDEEGKRSRRIGGHSPSY